MSRQISSIVGMVRNALKTPLGPLVSPTLMSIPYFSGIKMPCCHTLEEPQRMVTTTASAPSRTSRRSVVAVTVAGYPPIRRIFSQTLREKSRRSLLVSTRAISAFSSRGKVRMSLTRLRVKT